MANAKVKPQGGSKRGHSNMSHWTKTAEIKVSAKKRRRAERDSIIRKVTTDV